MQTTLKFLSVSSLILVNSALVSEAELPVPPTITRQPCGSSVCLSVPGVTPPPSGGSVVASQDFDSSNGGCTVIDVNGPFEGPWTYNAQAGTWSSAGQNAELQRAPSTRLTCPAVTLTQAGNVRISFIHRYSFEDGGGYWDGGALQVSVNGGTFVTVPALAFVTNGYNSAVRGDSASELRGQGAFVATSPGYSDGYLAGFIPSIADIGCLSAGDKVSVRFLAAYDTNTRNGNPAWEIDSISITEGVAANGSVARLAVWARPTFSAESISVQWQKSVGGDYTDIAGANNGLLAFAPVLGDNGSCYRAIVTSPGGSVTSAVACLTVTQPNTPPTFTCGTNVISSEDSGPQTVTGWAANIVAYSFPPSVPTIKFTTVPSNSQLFGVAAVSGGVLHLTDAQDSTFGAFSLNLPGTNLFPTFSASWKSLIGGGAGGADGYSFNVGDNLPYPPVYGNPGEDGAQSGLSVTFDTWDSGAPDIVGIEIRWQGNRVASKTIPKDNDGTGNYLRKDTFVNASVTVDATGLATLNYDGNTVSAQLSGYAGISANRIMFGARTGDDNDNHWIDDLSGGSWINSFLSPQEDPAFAEQSQTVSFQVSNDNPGLFSSQPAVSPNGTLTYTPAPNACGVANVTVVAKDTGGADALCGGNDTSAPCHFTITVSCLNDCPTASGQTVSVTPGGSVNFQLSGSDLDGDALQFLITQPPLHGAVVANIQTGAASYTPTPGYVGPDNFKFKVDDGQCSSASATVSITVGGANRCPTAVAKVSPNVQLLVGQTDTIVITANGSNACVTLDGTMSSDPDGDALTYVWVVDGTPTASGAIANTCLALGTHIVTLVVDDGRCARSQATTVDVLTPCEAEGALIILIQDSSLPRNVKQSLVSSVKSACSSFERLGLNSGVNQLQAFKNKVRTHVRPLDLALAYQLEATAQAIIDALSGP